MRMNKIAEKPRLLGILKDVGFDVPDFLFMSGEDFEYIQQKVDYE